MEPNSVRDGIFSLNTRRFGTVAELMIKTLVNVGWGKNLAHDLHDEENDDRIEVKFSRALKKSELTITPKNLLRSIMEADDRKRMFSSNEWKKYEFDCNIQQIKKEEFDVLYYGIFFSDKVIIFKILPKNIDKAVYYSNKQHRGNEGEGQFHLNNSTYEEHLKNFMFKELTYQELLTIFSKISKI